MPQYNLEEDSVQDKFRLLRSKIQIFGGGYGNGKTAAACVSKALPVAVNYPGANILIARATYPKLNDTIRKEFIKWCPKNWIKSFPLSKNADNTCTFVNGTTINFRYIAQQGKNATDGEASTSNLLSATYDLIIVDQLEDPEIVEKDFDDLLGRLRGNTLYVGDDPTMPPSGPRWFIGMVNPTGNWVYRRIIKPYHDYKSNGTVTEKLLCKREPAEIEGMENPKAGEPILDEEGKPELLVDVVEGSTYTNKHNLGEDFIQTLESVYTGQAKERYLYGKWKSYEGLVHPDFDEMMHTISRSEMSDKYNELVENGVLPEVVEAYDYGGVEPSCYLIAFCDNRQNVFVYNGFYKSTEKMPIEEQQQTIHEMRHELFAEDTAIQADPALFKKTQANKRNIKTLAQVFKEGEYGVNMRSADNNVERGIAKVNSFLAVKEWHVHPFAGGLGAPHIYFANDLQWIFDEFNGYFWKRDNAGKSVDIPQDRNDHAMNTIKYLVARLPSVYERRLKFTPQPHLTKWQVIGR